MAMMQTVQTQEVEAPEPAVNVTVTDNVQLEMLQLLRTMQQTLTANTNRQNEGNPTGQRRHNRNRRTPDDASFNRQVTNQYCWTHGGCNHSSGQCSRKAPGHQDGATFENHMGGSNAFCPP